MEQIHSREANSVQLDKFTAFYATPRFFTVFARARQIRPGDQLALYGEGLLAPPPPETILGKYTFCSTLVRYHVYEKYYTYKIWVSHSDAYEEF
jgi:hypothetical protein